MTKPLPLVTVFFQTYNRPQLLIEALESIFRQTFTDFNVIIFDNGSTPPVIPPTHILTDQRFQIIRNDDNASGRAMIYHTVCSIKTKYTAFLCDDDRWEDEKLARQVEILEKEEALVGCFTHAALIDSNEILLESAPGKNNIFHQSNRSQSEWVAHFFRYGNCLCHPSSLLRTSALKRSFNNSYCQLPDFATWVNLLAYGNIHIIEEPLTRFNWASDIGRESAMDKAKTLRLYFEQSRILHQFRKLPASVLGPAFGLTEDFAETDIPELLFNVAHQCGTDWHFRFAAELAEEQLTAYIQKGDREKSSLWGEHYAQASGKQATETPDHLESGIAHFQSGNFEAALQSLSRCIAANPDEVEAYFYLALICAAQGMMPESASFIHEALMLAPERSDLQAQLGEYCLEKGHIEAGRQHLAEAVARQADLFPAYPGLAEAMRQSGQLAEAAELLESVASYPGPTQSAIVAKLLEVLTQQGNLERIVACCNRARQDLALQGLGIRLQTRSGIDAQHLRQALERLHSRLCPPTPEAPARKPKGNGPARIAFVLSDFQRITAARHLELLLRRLPAKDFLTILVDNDPNTPGNELAERSALLADRYIHASMLDDDALAQSLSDATPDILVDLDGPGARQRLAAICRVNAPLKLSWSDLPPWGLPGLRQMSGEWLQPTENGGVPPLALEGLGEFLELPATEIVRAAHEAPRFACLTPSIRVSEDSWECFASLLKRLPDALLVVNLGELAGPAQQRIVDIFARREINADRLHFIRANDTEALCAIWNEVDVGLAPLHGDGDDALPTCLWMERPYVALDSPHSWSRRPAALLQLAGLGHLVAVDRENYQKIAEQLIHTPLAAPGRDWLRRSPLTDASHFVADFATRLAKALIAS